MTSEVKTNLIEIGIEELIQELKNYPVDLKLKRLRLFFGLTQVQLSKEIGCDRWGVSIWESGKRVPSERTLEKIRQYYRLPFDFFFDDKKV